MPYCRYCLYDRPIEEMYASKTCNLCHKQHLKEWSLKAKRVRGARRTRAKYVVDYYFKKERIKHAPFPKDIPALTKLMRHVISANRYRSRLLSLDHIIPVQHPHVSGLTVSWNMQVLLTTENTSKGNYCDLEEQARWLLKRAQDLGL